MIRRHLLRLAREQRGVATIEFALLSVLFFFVMTAALDLGMWYQQRLRLDSAVEQGGMIAFNQRTTVDATAAASITTYVGAAAKLASSPTVTITCNGGACINSGRTCACISGTAPTYTTAACNATCADGSLAGYYMKINAVATSNTMLVPAAMLGGSMTQTRTALVRLQ
jgi:Flp pilus assembly protein TadG